MKYDAFISYSHQIDSNLAPAIQRSLEKFAKPLFARKSLKIFRDSNDLSASPDLWGSIENGLNNSEYFIFIASTAAAQSMWCRKEIEHWKTHKDISKLLIVLVDGDLAWNTTSEDFDWSKTTALPDNLANTFDSEPLFVDFREGFTEDDLNLDNPHFKNNVALLAATIHKKSVGEMIGEATLQHKRVIRIRNSVIFGLTALLATSIFLTIFAFKKMNEADEQKKLAELETKRVLLSNYVSAIQAEVLQDPTKALRLAEYTYTFAKKNNLSTEEVTKHLIKVFYSGYAFYQDHEISKKVSPLDREIRKGQPDDYDCYFNEHLNDTTIHVEYSLDDRFSFSPSSDGLIKLRENELYEYCNAYFPYYRDRMTFMNKRYPMRRIYFHNKGSNVLTESIYIPWNPDEYAPMPDGYEKHYYHNYKTDAYPYVEDVSLQIKDEALKSSFYETSLNDTINWNPKLGNRKPASPIAYHNSDSTYYMTNIGLYNSKKEQLISLVLSLDELVSNYNYAFSEDNRFVYVIFQKVAPRRPELDRQWIYTLDPELIIARLNNSKAMGHIARLSEEDKDRFLISE